MTATRRRHGKQFWVRLLWVSALLSLLVLAWTAAPSPSRSIAAQPPCQARFGADPLDVAMISKRRRVSCPTARRIVIRFMHAGGGDGTPRTVRGWWCRWYPPGVSPGPSCRKSHRLIKFATD